MRKALNSTFALWLVLAAAAVADSTSWPHLRGPHQDGTAQGGDVFSAEDFGLEVTWKAPLGPAYSGISVADDRVVTLYSDGESDLAIALDAATGKKLWTYRIDSVYLGRDGSTDGPLSTPLLADGKVYAIGARGQLFALEAADGKELWSVHLAETMGGTEPHFGFTTTPILADGVLVVQVGGKEGHSVVGLNPANGEVVWSRLDDSVDYQSPTLMTLAGRSQIVAVGSQFLSGLDAKSGDILWQHPVAEGERVGSAHPTAIGDDRFLFFASQAAAVFGVSAEGDGFKVEEVYRSRELGRTYALPVLHDGHLYGFSGQFLTCVKADTGEKVWKSRPPGGRGLILVDDRLVIFGGKGEVVVAAASPEGYQELARVQALEGNAYTWPSFAGGRIFVRNLEEIAAIEVGKGSNAGEAVAEHALTRLAEKVAAADDKAAVVDAFLAQHGSFPIVDGEWVHFLYRGDAQDVGISGRLVGDGNEGLERLPGTDLFHYSARLEPGTRWEYRFIKDLDENITDPMNPRTVPAQRGPDLSELVLPGYETPAHAEPVAEGGGTVETLAFRSKGAESDREIKVYLPSGYAESERSYPLLLVHEPEWSDKGALVHTLDHLAGESVEPVVVAFITPSRQWWTESGGSNTVGYSRMLAEELVPFLEGKYRLEKDAASRAVFGAEGYGLTATYAALAHPEVFGKAGVYSVHLGAGSLNHVMELLEGPRKDGVEVFVAWNRWDLRRHDMGLDYRTDSQKLTEMLESRGYSVSGGEQVDSLGWGASRAVGNDLLEALFPLQGGE